MEIWFVRFRDSVGGVQGAEDSFPAGLTSRLVLTFAVDENNDFIGIGIGDVADTLDFSIAKPAAKLVHIGRLGKTDIHVGATLEIDPVANSTTEKNRSPPSEEKNATQGKEILGFAHPVDVGLLEELDHSAFTTWP